MWEHITAQRLAAGAGLTLNYDKNKRHISHAVLAKRKDSYSEM